MLLSCRLALVSRPGVTCVGDESYLFLDVGGLLVNQSRQSKMLLSYTVARSPSSSTPSLVPRFERISRGLPMFGFELPTKWT